MKLIAKSEEEFRKQVQRVKTFSDAIHMEFGLKNMLILHLRMGN